MKKPNNLKIIVSWVAVVVWYGFILLLSSIPNLRISSDVQTDATLRIPAHFFEYIMLSMLLVNALWQSRKKPSLVLVLSFIIVLGLSIFDEYWQSTIPTRTWELKDLMWDNAANAFGLFLARILIIRI